VLAQSTERRWQRAVQHERSLRVQLQENIETLANEMHGLEARCQENTGASGSGVTVGDRKPHLPGLLHDSTIPLPGKPLQFSRVSSEAAGKVSLLKESDTESVSSASAAILESTDGGQLSTTVAKEDDEDSEFFDALEHSNTVTSSSVTTATENVELLTVKDTDLLTSTSLASTTSVSPKVQLSGATRDKEDHLPGPERIDRQLSVSFICFHISMVILTCYHVEPSGCYRQLPSTM